MRKPFAIAVLMFAALSAAPAHAFRSTVAVLASALGDEDRRASVAGYVSDPYGRVVFRAVFKDRMTGDLLEDGIFFREGPLIAPVALQGYAGDDPGLVFASRPGETVFSEPTIGGAGKVVFAGEYARGADKGRGLFGYDGAYVRRILGAGAMVPGAAATFEDFASLGMLADGRVVFSGFYDAANDSADGLTVRPDGVFVLGPEGVETVARVGEESPVPGKRYVRFGPPRASPSGRIAFGARLREGANESDALLLYEDGALLPIVLPGELVPGVDAAFTAIKTDSVSINESGRVAFAACYGDCTTRSGVFTWDAGAVEPVAMFRPFDLFSSFGGAARPAITASGAVAFTGAQLTDLAQGVFLSGPYGLQSVALLGEPISGNESHAAFGDPVPDGAEGLAFSSTSDAGEERIYLVDPEAETSDGDINLDGRVDEGDAGIALAAGLEAPGLGLSDLQLWRADADASGAIDIRDAFGILGRALGR